MQEAVPQNQYGKKSGADARARSEGGGWGRAGGRTGLFLKTCSQKDHILALLNQNHVAGKGDRTAEATRSRSSRRYTHRSWPRTQVRGPPCIQLSKNGAREPQGQGWAGWRATESRGGLPFKAHEGPAQLSSLSLGPHFASFTLSHKRSLGRKK